MTNRYVIIIIAKHFKIHLPVNMTADNQNCVPPYCNSDRAVRFATIIQGIYLPDSTNSAFQSRLIMTAMSVRAVRDNNYIEVHNAEILSLLW